MGERTRLRSSTLRWVSRPLLARWEARELLREQTHTRGRRRVGESGALCCYLRLVLPSWHLFKGRLKQHKWALQCLQGCPNGHTEDKAITISDRNPQEATCGHWCDVCTDVPLATHRGQGNNNFNLKISKSSTCLHCCYCCTLKRKIIKNLLWFIFAFAWLPSCELNSLKGVDVNFQESQNVSAGKICLCVLKSNASPFIIKLESYSLEF